MSFETDIIALINPLVGNRVWFDEVPNVQAIVDPVVTLAMLGGSDDWYVEAELPDHKNTRLQVTVWGRRRDTVNATMRLIESQICHSNFPAARPFGALVGEHDKTLALFGARQDFGIWYLP